MEKIEDTLTELQAGRIGFVSLTRLAKETGYSVEELRPIFEADGHTVELHGKYGICAFRCEAAS